MSRTVTAELAKPATFAHFVVKCRDLKKSIAWYEDVLGMRIQHGNDFIAFMTYDDEHHRLALAQIPNQELPAQDAAGVDHVAYTLGSMDELLGTYKRLREKGIEPAWSINHGLTTSLYYADPDGLRIEFQVENYATKEELNAYIQGPDFEENPIGIEFDPDVLTARFENGDPMEDLVKLGSAPVPA